jgi:cell division initiation protein
MALTPVEIRHLKPPRTTFRGYKADATDSLLEEIAASFEDVWRERADLADKVEQLETDLVRFRELETLLRTTLVSAEQASAQKQDQAQREAVLILSAAHAEAREIQRHAMTENERLRQDSRRLRQQLQEALSVFGEPETRTAPEQPATADDAADGTEERSWYGEPDADAA